MRIKGQTCEYSVLSGGKPKKQDSRSVFRGRNMLLYKKYIFFFAYIVLLILSLYLGFALLRP